MVGWSKSRARGNAKFFFSIWWQLFDSINVGFLWNEAGLLVRECKWMHWDHKASSLAAPRKGSSHKSLFFILTPIAGQKTHTILLKLLIILLFNYALFSSFLKTLLSLFYSFTFASSKWRAKPVMPWLSNLLLACFYTFSHLPHSSVFFLSLSHPVVLLLYFHPSTHLNLILLTPLTGQLKNLLFIHHIAESDIKNGSVFFLFFFLKLRITKGTVQRKERQQGKQKGWKVREGLNPGIKISQLFLHSPPATFQLFLKYLAMSISKWAELADEHNFPGDWAPYCCGATSRFLRSLSFPVSRAQLLSSPLQPNSPLLSSLFLNWIH